MQDDRVKKLLDLYRRAQEDPNYRNENMGEIFVPGRGSLESGLVLIGEAPGREEERERAPFVGPAGLNLNSLLASIGLTREQVFITNLVKYRPRSPRGENRAPTARESRYALPYLLEELIVLDPDLVVCLGLSAAKTLLEDPGLKMSEANGTVFELRGFKVLVTYHPSPYNYKVPEKREATQASFKRLQQLLQELKQA
jgi:DNA polymerase